MAETNTATTIGGQHTTSQGGGIVNRVKEGATAQLTTQKDRGIDAIGNVTQAVRSSTQKLRDEKHDTIAGYVDKAADQIEKWSQQLRAKDADELIRDVQRLARRQPAVFIGSAFAIGLIGARFLKSSRGDEADRGNVYRGQYGGGSRMSTVNDRTAGLRDDRDVMNTSRRVAIPDAASSPTPSGGKRKSSSRTERT
jgi:hypothetical protein